MLQPASVIREEYDSNLRAKAPHYLGAQTDKIKGACLRVTPRRVQARLSGGEIGFVRASGCFWLNPTLDGPGFLARNRPVKFHSIKSLLPMAARLVHVPASFFSA